LLLKTFVPRIFQLQGGPEKGGAKVGIGSDFGDEVFLTNAQSVGDFGLGVEAARLKIAHKA
jgi:hypothetical protein